MVFTAFLPNSPKMRRAKKSGMQQPIIAKITKEGYQREGRGGTRG
jgi:hypothetical protein